jgi:hypothetical protein
MHDPSTKDALQEIDRQLFERATEKDELIKLFAAWSDRQPKRESRLLNHLLAKPGGLNRFLQALTKDSEAIEDALVKVSGKTLKELVDQPGGIARYLQKLARDTEAIGRLVVELLPGPRGYQRLYEALDEFKDEPVRQVKFECSETFYTRLIEEKLQRNLTVQQLAVRALERYFAVPESVHRRIEEQAAITSTPLPELFRGVTQFLSTFVQPGKLGEEPAMDLETQLIREHMDAILHYLQQLPYEKVEQVRESLELDLKYYRTSRFKRTGQRKRAPGTDSGNSEGDD